jgi:diacylglycerol kinase (ATP)
MRKRFFLIFNKDAGTSRLAAVRAVVAELAKAGAAVTWSAATTAAAARAEAAEAARSAAFDAVVAAGGDGTMRQVAAGVAGSGVPLGCVMLGTGNVLAHELALPRRAASVARSLLHDGTCPVELGLANGEPFLLMAGVGLDGRIVAALDHRVKSVIGRAAYVAPALRTLRLPLDRLEVEIDGRTFPATWAVITGARCYGGAFQLTGRTSLREPGLQAVLVRSRSRAQLVGQLLALARGRFDRRAGAAGSGIVIVPCAAAEVRSSGGAVPVQIDGDAFDATPLRVSARGGGHVGIIVPPSIPGQG